MSGKKAKAKRKAIKHQTLDKTLQATAQAEPPKLVMAPPVTLRKLDLACGQNCQPGFEGVDIWEGAQHRVDLSRYPWPFETSSIDEIHCSHYVEHIYDGYVDEKGRTIDGLGQLFTAANGQDALFRFFDEVWRILKPDGIIKIIVPCGRSSRGFQDPTHRRFFMAETFLYFNAEWRKMNKLDHYNTKCHFLGDVVPSIDAVLTTRIPEVQTDQINRLWNTVYDWLATMKAIKGEAQAQT